MDWKERILINVISDEELDVFGLFKKRRLLKEQQEKKIDVEKARQHNINFYKVLVGKLIDIYGEEGAMPYLKILFKDKTEPMEVVIR